MKEATTGELFRSVRKSVDMTQVELSSRLKVSQGGLSKIENDILEPSMMNFIDLWQLAKTKRQSLPIRDWLNAKGLA